MKRIFISVLLLIFGMTAFAQDMSYFTMDYMRADGSFSERLAILEIVRDMEMKGIGEFYHQALSYLLQRAPNITRASEQEAAEKSVIILAQGLGAEKYTAAGRDLWHAADYFDVVRPTNNGHPNNGHAMQAALIALGQIDGRDFINEIIQRLNDYNTQTFRGEAKLRVQTAVVGCVSALESFKDPAGYRPVFFVAYISGYDPAIKQIAVNALPNILDDPGEIISEIIRDQSITPDIKLVAWYEMLKTRAPAASKASVAANALATGWLYTTSNRTFQTNLRELRKSAINAIREFGAADDSIYDDLERSYSRNFITSTPDFDEITATLNTLAALKTEKAVDLLLKFLRELHARRRSGPWANKERQVYEWVVSSIGITKTQSTDVILLLTTISRTDSYTPIEQRMASNALSSIRGN